MKTILRVKQNDRFFYVLAEKFVTRYKICAIDNTTECRLPSDNLSYCLTEIVDGKLTTNQLGYIADTKPGDYLLWIRLSHDRKDKPSPNTHYFDCEEICICEQVYTFF